MAQDPIPFVDGYEQLRPIGKGGSARVYQARQARLGRDVALKVLRHASIGEQGRRLFDIERNILASLPKFAYIVSVYDGGFTGDGDPWLAMELCPGGSLADLVKTSGPLDLAHVVRVGHRVAAALDFAHRRQLIHRDVKPENVLLSELGEPVLSDFGIASVLGQDTSSNDNGLTPHHVAPEILHSIAAGPASDLYSLGSTIYTLAVGYAPHQRGPDERPGIAETLHRVLNDPSVELPDRFDGPKSLRTLVRSLLVKDHTRRPAHAADVVAAFRAIERELGIADHELPIYGARGRLGEDERIPTLEPSLPRNAEPSDEEIDEFATVHVRNRFDPRDEPSSARTVDVGSFSSTKQPPKLASTPPSSVPSGETSNGEPVQPVRRGEPVDVAAPPRLTTMSGGDSDAHATMMRSSAAAAPLTPPTVIAGNQEVRAPLDSAAKRRVMVGVAVAAVVIIGAIVGSRLLQKGERRDVADTAPPVAVTEVEVISLRKPRIEGVRAINDAQVEVAWSQSVDGATYGVEVTRSGGSDGLEGEPRLASSGATSLVVEDLALGTWTPCFVVVARDPATDRIERSDPQCLAGQLAAAPMLETELAS